MGAMRNPEPAHLRSQYNRTSKLNRLGITRQDFAELLALQSGKCANKACKNVAEVIDHDHATGKVRGLLCLKCNSGLGFFDDDPEKLRGALQYLESRSAMALKGGVRLKKASMSNEARERAAQLMRGNKYAIGNHASSGREYSIEERAQRSARGKKRWAAMTADQQEIWRENGRHNAKKRWGESPSEIRASRSRQ